MARRGTWRALALMLGLAAPFGADTLMAAPPPGPPGSAAAAAPRPQGGGSIQLKVRRQADAVELVVEGTGAGPQLQQSSSGNVWLGQVIIGTPGALRVGPQRLTIPELGLQSVSLEGSGTSYRLAVTPMQGVPLGRPVVSADGRNLIISFPASPQVSSTTARFDITQPGRIPGQAAIPPLQPRAVAPPLGDMAVGTMVLRNRSHLNVSGPPVSMTIRNAQARDVLMTLAQMGGYGFVYVDDAPVMAPGGGSTSPAVAGSSGRPVSIAFQREPYARAFNAVLLAAGWQSRLEGRMIMAGPSVLSQSFGAQVSKVYRLNQASAGSAADYLASLGASITKVNVITNSVTQGTSQASQVAGGSVSQQTTSQNITTTETYGGGNGPLKGLLGTTDSRLQTITLIGDSQLIAVGESYLRQIDLRQRQVALSVRILDVSLDNDAAISNSFAFRYGNNFIVSDQGQLVGSFGSLLPPRDGVPSSSGQPVPGAPGTGVGYPYGFAGAPANPGQSYPANNFFNVVQALITSSSAKTLASPTLFLTDNPEVNQVPASSSAALGSGAQVGSGSIQIQPVTDPGSPVGRNKANEAYVVVGENVVQSYQVTAGSGTSPNTCQPIFGVAGLTLGARVKRIDDNGFVTFNLSPAITAVTKGTVRVDGCGTLNTLTVRALDSGDVRVRDGQTLILTGVIADSDIQQVRKWPLLGDIPFVGQFFRASEGNRSKRELVILVTPKIVNDLDGGSYGYGFRPDSREARGVMSSGL